MAGVMSIKDESGIEIYCLPDCAKCTLTGKSPEDMDECPGCYFDTFGYECHPGECEYYTEDWEATDHK